MSFKIISTSNKPLPSLSLTDCFIPNGSLNILVANKVEKLSGIKNLHVYSSGQTPIFKNTLTNSVNNQAFENIFVPAKGKTRILAHDYLHNNVDFCGRTDELLFLETYFKGSVHKNSQTKLMTVYGISGIGKTELVKRFVFKSYEKYKVIWVFQSENEDKLYSDFVMLGKKLGIQSKEKDDDKSKEKLVFKIKNELITLNSCLLIFENTAEISRIKKYIPPMGANVLITSQNDDWKSKYRLEPFNKKDTIEYFRKVADPNIKISDKDILKLGIELSFFPLALAQAIGYMNYNKITVDQYLNKFHMLSKKLMSTVKGSLTEHPPFYLTMRLILEKIANTRSRDILNVCSFIDTENIPKSFIFMWLKNDIFQETVDNEMFLANLELELNDHLDMLRKFSLIHVFTDTISIHSLTRRMIKESINLNDSSILQLSILRTINKDIIFTALSNGFSVWDINRMADTFRGFLGSEIVPQNMMRSIKVISIIDNIAISALSDTHYSLGKNIFEKVFSFLEMSNIPDLGKIYFYCLGAYGNENQIQKAISAFLMRPNSDIQSLLNKFDKQHELSVEKHQFHNIYLLESLLKGVLLFQNDLWNKIKKDNKDWSLIRYLYLRNLFKFNPLHFKKELRGYISYLPKNSETAAWVSLNSLTLGDQAKTKPVIDKPELLAEINIFLFGPGISEHERCSFQFQEVLMVVVDFFTKNKGYKFNFIISDIEQEVIDCVSADKLFIQNQSLFNIALPVCNIQ